MRARPTISEISESGLRPEYIFKCIFHATNFGPPLVEICNSFEPVLRPRQETEGAAGEHYHLYEILCASLCIVIIHSLFAGSQRR